MNHNWAIKFTILKSEKKITLLLLIIKMNDDYLIKNDAISQMRSFEKSESVFIIKEMGLIH